MAKYRECEKAVKAAAFAEAIQTKETMPLSQTINLDKFGACSDAWTDGHARALRDASIDS